MSLAIENAETREELADRVQALGGRLEIESVRGKGTKVRAELPTKVSGQRALS